MFTLHPKGVGLLLKGMPLDVVWTVITSFLGLTAISGGVENYFFKKTTFYERLLLIAAGLILIYPVALFDVIGLVLMAAALVSQKVRKEKIPAPI
jgi:TRAP-type uncharacterized transport system fused permease subunit